MEDQKWKTLYRAGALAPLIALVFYLSQFVILVFGEPFPTSSEGWFALVERSKLLGLWYLNALDIVSWMLLGIMFLALYVALRRLCPSWMLIALYFALLGVVVFVVPRVLTLSMVTFTDLHAAATTEAQRTIYLTAGEALSQVSTATPQTLGFLLTTVGGLIISAVLMRGQSFGGSAALGKVAGVLGIVGFFVALANYASWIVAPAVATILMPINGLLWLVWWLMMSAGLFRLAKGVSDV